MIQAIRPSLAVVGPRGTLGGCLADAARLALKRPIDDAALAAAGEDGERLVMGVEGLVLAFSHALVPGERLVGRIAVRTSSQRSTLLFAK